MKVTILIDNTPSEDSRLYSEHGLSLFIETDNTKFLCDTGASDKFIANAETLGVDLQHADFAVISHGHNDHSGGLVPLVNKFPQLDTYISSKVVHTQYFSARHATKKDISTNQNLFEIPNKQIHLVEKNCVLTPEISLVYTESHPFSMPFGNKYLSKKDNYSEECADDFTHEISVAISTDKGLVILSPCSHNGAANIIDACQKYTGIDKVYAYIGGLHFVDSEFSVQEVEQFKEEIKGKCPDIKIFTGHCTGDLAKEQIQKSITGSTIFRTGMVIQL